MFRSRFAKLGAAGFAAIAGAILVVSSVGAHQSHASGHAGLSPFTEIASSTRLGKEVEQDAAADAAALAAKVQQEAAEAAAAQAKAAAEAAEAQQDATETEETGDSETGDTETGDTETGDTETGTVQSGDDATEHASTTTVGTKSPPKPEGD